MTSTPDHSRSALLSHVDKYQDDTGTDIDSELVPLSESYNTDGLAVHDIGSTLCPSIQHGHCQFSSSRHCPRYPEILERTDLMAEDLDTYSQRASHNCLGSAQPELRLSPLQEPLRGAATSTPPIDSLETLEESQPPSAYRAQALIPDVCQKPKHKMAETTIEMSTQTERDMSDYSVPIPLPQPPPPPPPAMIARSNSRASLNSAAVGDVCRICHCESEPGAPLISPCVCCGSLKYVHQSCLQQWIKSADTKSCELCKFNFEMTTRIKPFRKWQKLEMTTVERRKIMCSVTFHIIAITCVIWSLYVLIDRTTEEIKMGILEWPFWTKLIVVAIGFTGGLVFMYVQCKMYVQLCRRWRAYNRVIYIQNCPNKTGQRIPLQPHMLDDNGCHKESTTANQATVPAVQETELL